MSCRKEEKKQQQKYCAVNPAGGERLLLKTQREKQNTKIEKAGGLWLPTFGIWSVCEDKFARVQLSVCVAFAWGMWS